MMESYEAFLKEATTPGPNRTLPGVAVIAVDGNGITYSHTAGTQSVDPESPLKDKPFTLDTTCWIASCTKLLTQISALQCVERGLLTLDGDISEHIHELKDIKILTGFEDEDGEKEKKPVYTEAKNKVTLRQLLSHSSGFGYAPFDPKLQKEFEYHGKEVNITDDMFKAILQGPLMFEPGTSWTYGTGIDVAGQAVERVTKLSLEEYFQANIFKPLGMNNTSFRLTPELKANRADMTLRPPGQTELMQSPTRYFSDDVKIDAGGAGLWSCPSDYAKVLSALLKTPSPLLKPESLDLLFTGQLSPSAKKTLHYTLFGPYPGNEDGLIGNMFHGATLPQGTPVDYSLGGIIATDGVPGGRSGNAVAWGGLPNLVWTLDRERGRGILYASQLLPPGDTITGKAAGRFEREVLGEGRGKL